MRHLRFLRYVDQVARSGSIRKAADTLNVTASALNRRIMDMEDELGTQLFERRPRGMRLTAAGEVFARFIRSQFAETERMRSQIEDLKGLRRGNVRIACSQALAHGFLPEAISVFQRAYPLITFEVNVSDHERAMQALAALEVDVLLVFRPPQLPNFRPLLTLKQRLVVLMAAKHPLAKKKTLRLSDCRMYPLALPERSIGGRQLLDEVTARAGLSLAPSIQSNSFEFLRGCVARGQALSFQIEVGALPDYLAGSGVIALAIDQRDVPHANLVLGQLRDRNLPSAAAIFCEHLKKALQGIDSSTP
ncbi:LysR family transcriptional regulator [Bradyrhizobium prioriisuperbiae]|uniref:LysR family transcriptional regulator n=1 Tax=Bradyrhizobium prioriisuperbiae TaxID=2854389 RepID=UPI0028E476F6|nr:LysR family transcriptional regulator [Bradyrhizobium prioritasuperba]